MSLQAQLFDLRDEDPAAIVMLRHTTSLARMHQQRAVTHIESYFRKLGLEVKRVSLYMHLDALANTVDPNPWTRLRPQTRPRPPQVGYVVFNSTEDAETLLQLPKEHRIENCAICVERFKPDIAWRERL